MTWNWIPSGSFTFDYTPTGQYGKITFSNGQTRNFSYDNQGRLTSVSNEGGGSVLASFAYGYDYDWGSGTDTMLGQRTSVYVSAPAGTNLELGTTKYRYDSRYQLVRVDHPSGVYETWTYDAIGNRTSTLTSAYSYYKNGQNPLNGQRLRTYSAGFPDLLYDANGNLTGQTNLPNTYAWDYAGRLTSSSGVSYAYDHLGRRRSATSGNSTTKYISFGAHTVGERNTTSGVATDYLFGPGIDEPLAKITASGAVSYYGVDGLGSIVLVTSATGTITGSTSYGAWGGNSSELFGFTGREGSFFRARYYDAGWGRFISEDPMANPATPLAPLFISRSIYAYVANNPVALTDPWGLFGDSAIQTIGPTADALADFLRKYYEDMRRRRIDGHRRFPGPPNSRMRHCVSSCEAALAWGVPLTRVSGVGNEVQGMFIDLANLRSRITGRTPTAFELNDLRNNERGFGCAGRIGHGCASCTECCSGTCGCKPSIP